MAASLLECAPVVSTRPLSARGDVSLRQQIRRVLCGTQHATRVAERRRETRHPFPYPIYLSPAAPDDDWPNGPPLVVLGRHLSECGLDFYHQQPLAVRRVIASFDLGHARWLGVQLDLSWCQFNRFGWYVSGGRFLGLAPSPLETNT